ncbi:MAG: glycosyltransferase family 39 protein [Coleofasciculus chthonoplastes F3-SA18-01]|uniref:glycosyltransferase family 39 protein n=1 Tax=Coleofasciculus chthonoplastes TaxID=64178 RepID=UPI003301DB1A
MQSRKKFNLLLLLVWIVIGAALRFTNLTLKSLWTDEFATLVFSLGNSFQAVPLDEAISLQTLLHPLKTNPDAGVGLVWHHLLSEDHHPPLYFMLAHRWMQLFPTSGEYISLWAARSLPAFFGVLSIPAMYGFGWVAFRSQVVAQFAAAMMAVSPFGIYLAQEARHYTLGILWVIASLSCFVVAVQHLKRRTPLPIKVVLVWVLVNSLGIATHYFFSLTLFAEGIALMGLWLWHYCVGWKPGINARETPVESYPDKNLAPKSLNWWRILAAAMGTGVGGLVWIPVLQGGYEPQMADWMMLNRESLLSWINPMFQTLAAWITMVSLLPVESSSLGVVFAAGVGMIGFFVWVIPFVYRGGKTLVRQAQTRWQTGVLAGFVLSAISLFFAITYILGKDLTRGARYHFVYFPAVILLIAAALAVIWKLSQKLPNLSPWRNRGQIVVVMVGAMGLLSGITVVNNLGYQKYYRPDLFVPIIEQASPFPVLIATTHNTLVQTGEIMGIAWELKNHASSTIKNPQFLLAHQNEYRCQESTCPASTTLEQTLAQLPRPLDIWLVNFKATVADLPNCYAEDFSQNKVGVDGYHYQLYHCLANDYEGSSASDLP